MGSKISSKNQVTLPVQALREAGIAAGDRVRVVAQGRGRLTLTVLDDPLESLIGCAPGVSEAADLEGLRDEWAQ